AGLKISKAMPWLGHGAEEFSEKIHGQTICPLTNRSRWALGNSLLFIGKSSSCGNEGGNGLFSGVSDEVSVVFISCTLSSSCSLPFTAFSLFVAVEVC